MELFKQRTSISLLRLQLAVILRKDLQTNEFIKKMNIKAKRVLNHSGVVGSSWRKIRESIDAKTNRKANGS